MDIITLTMALLMGFTGSLHCAGMCGPIVWIMPFQAFHGFHKAFALALYHFGRISVYAFLAVVLHSFRPFFDPKVQQYISIGLGCALLIVGVLSFFPNHVIKLRLPWAGVVTRLLGSVMAKPGLSSLAFAGMLNGLLPCGLVYMALSASLSIGSAAQAALLMYIFGIGTLPMLISISLLKVRFTYQFSHFKKLVPVIVFSFGCLFVLRGMNLGIPYLSPRVVAEQHQIKSCCSHKSSR